MLTGYYPTAGVQPGPAAEQPAARASGRSSPRKLGPQGSVPPYVCLPKMHPSTGSAYLGAAAAPFVIDADPNAPDFAVPDVVPPPALELARLDDRARAAGRASTASSGRPRPPPTATRGRSARSARRRST